MRLFFAFIFLFLAGCTAKNVQTNKVIAPVRGGNAGVVPYHLERISRLTGATLPEDTVPDLGHTTKYSVGGTDLGIFWKMGDGRTGIFFGDTYGNDFRPTKGGPGDASQWRNNVLAFTNDNVLHDGLTIDEMLVRPEQPDYAIEAFQKAKGSHTAIPTSAVHIDGTDYVHYFDLLKWNGWVTAFSSIYKSTDNGNTWQRCYEVVFNRGSKFSVVAYAQEGDWIYMIGSATLRKSEPYLARFKKGDILKQSRYEYWNISKGWVRGNEAEATAIFPGPVGEASLFYHEEFKSWIYVYLNDAARRIELRDAEKITGPWSEARMLVSADDYPGLYGPFIHPGSKGEDLYFTMSQWRPYNVYFMRAKLKYVN